MSHSLLSPQSRRPWRDQLPNRGSIHHSVGSVESSLQEEIFTSLSQSFVLIKCVPWLFQFACEDVFEVQLGVPGLNRLWDLKGLHLGLLFTILGCFGFLLGFFNSGLLWDGEFGEIE